tara:strand:- start:531 stop:1859 length:1329 start_codon:yes stop_codon:yes gene_type:complete
MSKPVLLVTAPVATRSGYGAHARDIVRSLIELDKYDVKIWNVRWGTTPLNALDKSSERDKPIIDRLLSSPQLPNQPDIHIHIVVPNEFSPIGKYNIGITAGLECTVAPPDWVQGLNKMDMNIVPSTFVSNTFRNLSFDIKDEKTQQLKGVLKLEKPMEVLFEGIDSRVYKKTKEFSKELVTEMKSIQETFNFLYVGHWLQGRLGEDRKDTGMLVKVFLETFKNQKVKPGLILKTSGAGFSVLDREDILKKIRDIRNSVSGDLPNVYLLHGDLHDEEINELYNHPKVKAHVNITHGEGFGRPLLEASISGKPVIASSWSGHLDFLNSKQSVLVPGKMTDVPKSALPDKMYVEGAQWFTVDYQQASSYMKDVYKNYKKYTSNSMRLGKVNESFFSLKKMTQELGKILDNYIPDFPKEVELKLPKLKKVGQKGKPKIELPKLKRV